MNYLFQYSGSKAQFADKIIQHFPERKKYEAYVEPFMGSLGMILNKEKYLNQIEVINDFNSDLTNLFWVLQNKYKEFVAYSKFAHISSDYYKIIRAKQKFETNKIKRAFNYLYLMQFSHNGKGSSFAQYGPNAGISIKTLIERAEFVNYRLKDVLILNTDWEKVVNQFDSPKTLFYLDPPYWGTTTDGYGKGCGVINFDRFKEVVQSMKGYVVVSHSKFEPLAEFLEERKVYEKSITYVKASKNKATGREHYDLDKMSRDEYIYTNYKIYGKLF